MSEQAKTTRKSTIKTIDGNGMVSFHRRLDDGTLGTLIGTVDVTKLSKEALYRAAVHGVTQNILDASNSLEGEKRAQFIAEAVRTVQDGGWASAPSKSDPRETLIKTLIKMGFSAADAAKKADELGKNKK